MPVKILNWLVNACPGWTTHFRTSDTFNNNVNWGSITKPGEPRPDDTENVDMAVKPLNIGSDQAVTCQLRHSQGSA